MANIRFPDSFAFGTSTSASQIETPFEHDWINVRARDGHVLDRTTDHELRTEEDIQIIASLAPNYRMGLMWSKLQREPFGKFDEETRQHYHKLMSGLKAKDVNIMLVIHHFANPIWFAKDGGWENKFNIDAWLDFAKKVIDEFGHYATSWNTFNEPNLYTSMGWVEAEFPPYRKNIFAARRVIRNIASAHEQIYPYIKQKFPKHPVGISYNCTLFTAENIFGYLPAWFADLCYMKFPSGLFKSLDFFGMSYYAKIAFDPFPITNILSPEKITRLKKPHDDMWEYYPQGLRICMERFWKKFRKPIIITENGICTGDDQKRIKALGEYLTIVNKAIEDGIDVQAYYHWSTWDNFEWSLGPSYHFGLYGVDVITKDRFKKPSADVYSKIAYENKLPFKREI